MYTSTDIRACAITYICMRIYIYIYMYAYIYMEVYTHMYIHISIFTYVYIYICVNKCMQIPVGIGCSTPAQIGAHKRAPAHQSGNPRAKTCDCIVKFVFLFVIFVAMIARPIC